MTHRQREARIARYRATATPKVRVLELTQAGVLLTKAAR